MVVGIDYLRTVLLESVHVAKSFDLDYIIIGGWCPFLRNNLEISKMNHLGTFDVDILFKDASKEGNLSNFIETMLSKDYYLSAKHGFQLIKIVDDCDKNKIAVNVDLLHPDVDGKNENMFSDHFDLERFWTKDKLFSIRAKSIVAKGSQNLFDFNLFSPFESGWLKEEVCLMDFNGMLLTKMDSCQKIKRQKDSYELLMGFRMKGYDEKKLLKIIKEDDAVSESFKKFKKFLKKNDFDENVLWTVKNYSLDPVNPGDDFKEFIDSLNI